MTESLCPLLDAYLDLVDDTESPLLYHRWCFISGVAGMLNRRTKFEMATGAIYPNMFVVLLGPPGAKKSTSISMVAKLIKKAGYMHIASGKTSAEQFLMDLKEGFDAIRMTHEDLEMLTQMSLEETINGAKCSHALIQAGELQDFLGSSNLSFIGQLTNLWDNPDDYPYRLKNGTNELISKPTVSLIGGATQSTFKRMFPLDIIGQGLLSRFLLIHGAGSRKRVFLPTLPDPALEQEILETLRSVRAGDYLPESYEFSEDAMDFSKTLYESGHSEISDPRFQYYTNRRNDHYIKLCMAIAAMNLHDKLELNDCLLANTILSYTEKFMPLALGEFGLDQAAEHTEYLYKLLNRGEHGMSLQQLVSEGLSIFRSPAEVAQHLTKLITAKRVEKINKNGNVTYVPIERLVHSQSKMVNFNLLKEYRENPTFNTEIELSPEKALEYELKELAEAMQPDKDMKAVVARHKPHKII